MEKRLYVGNLPYNTTKSQLEELFSQAGSVVDASIVEDRDTGRPKGFGFVEMASEADAAAAIEKFDGKDFGGRNLKVAEARPRPPRSDRGRGGYGGGGYGGGYDGGRSSRW